MAQDFLENSYLYGANAAFIEELYARYVSNPAVSRIATKPGTIASPP
jgi:2-oxoglutarate dehydrogenase complex dehydrogenase (E1) component-like enzyme